jgi:hypothetical protein
MGATGKDPFREGRSGKTAEYLGARLKGVVDFLRKSAYFEKAAQPAAAAAERRVWVKTILSRRSRLSGKPLWRLPLLRHRMYGNFRLLE